MNSQVVQQVSKSAQSPAFNTSKYGNYPADDDNYLASAASVFSHINQYLQGRKRSALSIWEQKLIFNSIPQCDEVHILRTKLEKTSKENKYFNKQLLTLTELLKGGGNEQRLNGLLELYIQQLKELNSQNNKLKISSIPQDSTLTPREQLKFAMANVSFFFKKNLLILFVLDRVLIANFSLTYLFPTFFGNRVRQHWNLTTLRSFKLLEMRFHSEEIFHW